MIVAAVLVAGAVTCLPNARWGTTQTRGTEVNVIGHWQTQMTWNGALIDNATLRQYMDAVRHINPEPRTVIDTTSGDCAEIRRIAAIVDADSHCTPYLCLAYDVPQRQPPPVPTLRRD